MVWGTAAFLLLLPLVAMQFTEEVNWGAVDFIAFGAMLLAACGAFELTTRLSGNSTYRGARQTLQTVLICVRFYPKIAVHPRAR